MAVMRTISSNTLAKSADMPTTSAGTASGVCSLLSSIGPGLVTSRNPLHPASINPAAAMVAVRVMIVRIGILGSERGTEGNDHGFVGRNLIVLATAEACAGIARVVRFRIRPI